MKTFKRRKVIKRNNLPIRSPILLFVVVYLLTDKFDTPGWLYGVTATIFSIVLIAWVVELFREDEIDLLKDIPPKNPNK